jgi:hypothetical protein
MWWLNLCHWQLWRPQTQITRHNNNNNNNNNNRSSCCPCNRIILNISIKLISFTSSLRRSLRRSLQPLPVTPLSHPLQWLHHYRYSRRCPPSLLFVAGVIVSTSCCPQVPLVGRALFPAALHQLAEQAH